MKRCGDPRPRQGDDPPYSGTDTNDLLNKHVSAAIPAVDKFNPNATSAAAKLIRQLLAKQPAGRPKSMQEVLGQLRAIRLLEKAAAGA